jgi:hypothetical protein
MQYLATLYDHESPTVTPGTPEWDEDLKGYAAFGQKYAKEILGGNALHLTSTGFSVQAPSGSDAPLVTDGPFTETNEVVGGYYLLEAGSLDDVINIVRDIPVVRHPEGAVEVRPIVMTWAPESPVTKGPDDTRYLATIYGPETPFDIPDTPEWDRGAARHGQFIEKHAGALMNGLAVRDVATATTVRLKGGELEVTDGPASKTTVIGGAYELRAASKEDAVAVAQDIPTNHRDTWIEVRPIVEFG